MMIRHFLVTGFNTILLKNIRYATEHQKLGDVVTHVGWKIAGEYGGENPRSQKHKYEIIFSEEEAREHYDRLGKMLANFDDEKIKGLTEKQVEVAEE